MITKRQLELRKKSIGASDVAAILGLSPYRSAYDVWLEKTGKLEERNTESPAMEAGNAFEDAVLKFAEKELGKIRRNVWKSHKQLPLHAALDAQCVENGNPVEAKTAGLFSYVGNEWGEAGTDQVPEQYLIQAQVQLGVTGREVCHMPAFIGGRGFQMYHIQRNQALIDVIYQRVKDFWMNHVVTNIAPDQSEPSLEIAKTMKREPGKLTVIAPDLIAKWKDAQITAKTAKEQEDQTKAAIMAALGDAEASKMSEVGQVTYLQQTKLSLDIERMKEEAPEVYKTFAVESKYRVLRFKKNKEIKTNE
jgi:putative phage-type endonuclease